MRAARVLAAVAFAALTLVPLAAATPAGADTYSYGEGGTADWGHGFKPWPDAYCTDQTGTMCSLTAGARTAWSSHGYPNGFQAESTGHGCEYEKGWIKVCETTRASLQAINGCNYSTVIGCTVATYKPGTGPGESGVNFLDFAKIQLCKDCAMTPALAQNDATHEYGHALGLGHATTDTAAIMYPVLPATPKSPNTDDYNNMGWMYGRLIPGTSLCCDQLLWSPNGVYHAVMQATDGNFVVYQGNVSLWASNTGNTGAEHVIMQGDGNLVVYAGTTPKCSTATANHPGAYLSMQDDGNLVIYSNGVPIWSRASPCYH
jgi:hypothetical protein